MKSSAIRRAVLVAVIAVFILPLMTNPVARTYAWLIILGRFGVVNNILIALGLTEEPVRLLFTETAIVIGLLQLFLPLMVLPLVTWIRMRCPGKNVCAVAVMSIS